MGHVDGGRSIRAALCRESMEETGVIINPSAWEFAHAMQQRDGNKGYEHISYSELGWGLGPEIT